MPKKDRTNTISLLVLLIGALLLSYYAVVSLSSRDPLWVLNEFAGQPSRIIVYHDGQHTELLPGQAGFNELSGAVQTSLSRGFARLSNLGFSELSLQEAYDLYVSLEVYFQQPVELHTWFSPGTTTQMLFPITGRNADMSAVLLGEAGQYRAGAPILNDMEPIREALQSLGYY